MIGVVSESDLLAKLALGNGDDAAVPGMITGILRRQQLQKAQAVTAAELMTSPAYTVLPEDTVELAARIMYLRNVKRLPVVDSGGRLAGIVSRADVLAVYSRTDADIAEEIRTGILWSATALTTRFPGPPTSMSWPASQRTDPDAPTWRAAVRPSAAAAPGTWSGSGQRPR